MKPIQEISPLLLAYLGDSAMEVLVRKHLVLVCRDAASCNRRALEFVTAKSQSAVIKQNLDFLTEEERSIFTRAKNAKSHSNPRNTDLYSYRLATGLEAVFGYHCLCGEEERNEELFRHFFADRLIDESEC